MYTIKFKFEQKGLEPITLTNVEDGQSLLELALKNDIELHHNCGGVCACTTCHLYVVKGEANLSEPEDNELDRLDTAWDLRTNSRLGCQAVIRGDVTVEFPMYTRNYVQEGGGIQLGKSEKEEVPQ